MARFPAISSRTSDPVGLQSAEAEIHGKSIDDVHFHEIADWDSIADIVGAATAIEHLGAASWSVGGVPMGGGSVNTAPSVPR